MIPKVVQDAIDKFNGVDPEEKAKDKFWPTGRAARRSRRQGKGLTRPSRSRIRRGISGPTIRGAILTKGMSTDGGS